jgi:hypothetical protein
MKVVGFNFTKMSVEKLKEGDGEFKIKTGIEVPEINPVKVNFLKGEEELIEAKFLYTVNYTPDIAKVELEGGIIFSLESKLAKQILKDWKKKKLNENFRVGLFNIISRKASLKALELEDELNLPLHISMPTFKKSTDE